MAEKSMSGALVNAGFLSNLVQLKAARDVVEQLKDRQNFPDDTHRRGFHLLLSHNLPI
jgi:hypothetical protein